LSRCKLLLRNIFVHIGLKLVNRYYNSIRSYSSSFATSESFIRYYQYISIFSYTGISIRIYPYTLQISTKSFISNTRKSNDLLSDLTKATYDIRHFIYDSIQIIIEYFSFSCNSYCSISTNSFDEQKLIHQFIFIEVQYTI